MSLHACNTPSELVPDLFYCTHQKCSDLWEVDHHDRQQTERCHAAVEYANFHRGHHQRQSRWHPACSVHHWSCRRHSFRKDKRLSQDNEATEKRRPGVYQLSSPPAASRAAAFRRSTQLLSRLLRKFVASIFIERQVLS